MSKKRHFIKSIFSFIKSFFSREKNKLKDERNIFGDGGELEMVEYSRMILFIRTHYLHQSATFGHVDFQDFMIQLSKMSYVEVKALFAAILEIHAKTNEASFNKFISKTEGLR